MSLHQVPNKAGVLIGKSFALHRLRHLLEHNATLDSTLQCARCGQGARQQPACVADAVATEAACVIGYWCTVAGPAQPINCSRRLTLVGTALKRRLSVCVLF